MEILYEQNLIFESKNDIIVIILTIVLLRTNFFQMKVIMVKKS